MQNPPTSVDGLKQSVLQIKNPGGPLVRRVAEPNDNATTDKVLRVGIYGIFQQPRTLETGEPEHDPDNSLPGVVPEPGKLAT